MTKSFGIKPNLDPISNWGAKSSGKSPKIWATTKMAKNTTPANHANAVAGPPSMSRNRNGEHGAPGGRPSPGQSPRI